MVDDASTDQTHVRAEDVARSEARVRVVRHERNRGKGAAVQTGISAANLSHVLVQDADREYDPSDIPRLWNAVVQSGEPDRTVAFGSRSLGARRLPGWRGRLKKWPRQSPGPWLFGYVLSAWFAVVKRRWISDLLTGYKLYPRGLFLGWSPETSGFETDHEITMKILNAGLRIVEVPVSYTPRSKEEGKKINWRDAVKALRTVWRYR